MTSPAPAPAFPGGRSLAGWWRQLAPASPDRLWVGHFLLHRIEALVRVVHVRRLDAFETSLLRAVYLTPAASVASLAASLHLDAPIVFRLLGELQTEELVRAALGAWHLTESGSAALERGEHPQSEEQRRRFHFIEPWEPGGRRADRPPHFLALADVAVAPWPVAEGWDFDPAGLEACLQRPAEWKERFGFPSDVQELLTGESAGWRRVIVDRREHFVTVFALAPAGPAPGATERHLLGFSVRPEGWVLESERPAFVLRSGWQEVFPDLAHEPPLDAWRQAWRSWCQPRSIPPGESEACRLERHGHCLRVHAPRRLVDRLRTARSDALKGEAWLLAGVGSTRAAVVVELYES